MNTAENTWPGGERHAMTQTQHQHWNDTHYPGTRQICAICSKPTGRCEEDACYNEDGEPFCPQCADEHWYCDSCGVFVPSEHVTFEETHDVRNGGCGSDVVA